MVDVFASHGLDLLVCLNSVLTSDNYVSLLYDHLHPFMGIIIPKTTASMSYSNRMMHWVIEFKLPRISLKNILETNEQMNSYRDDMALNISPGFFHTCGISVKLLHFFILFFFHMPNMKMNCFYLLGFCQNQTFLSGVFRTSFSSI